MARKKYMGKKPKNVVPEPNVPFYDEEGKIIGYRELDKPASKSPLSKAEKEERNEPFAGGGRAMRGYGKAYMTGGRVGYRGGTLVGKGRRRGGAGGKSGQQ